MNVPVSQRSISHPFPWYRGRMAKQKTQATTTAKPKTNGNANKVNDKTDKVLVSVVLDRSGSMSSCREQTVTGYNKYLDELRTDTQTHYSVTLTQFNIIGVAPNLTVTYADQPLAQVPALTMQDYMTDGSTPLLDAIGECIRRTQPNGRGTIMVVITDGQENSSREFKKADIQALVKQKEAEGWSFVFLGADVDAYHEGGMIGASVANTANFQKSRMGQTYGALAQATMNRATAYRVSGQHVASTMSFFSANQKAAMDPNFDPNIVQPTTTTGSVTQTLDPLQTTGGSPAAQGTFPPATVQPAKPAPVEGKRRRQWATRTSA